MSSEGYFCSVLDHLLYFTKYIFSFPLEKSKIAFKVGEAIELPFSTKVTTMSNWARMIAQAFYSPEL